MSEPDIDGALAQVAEDISSAAAAIREELARYENLSAAEPGSSEGPPSGPRRSPS
jgi:hypothetical protein